MPETLTTVEAATPQIGERWYASWASDVEVATVVGTAGDFYVASVEGYTNARCFRLSEMLCRIPPKPPSKLWAFIRDSIGNGIAIGIAFAMGIFALEILKWWKAVTQ
jgi:hypothetical protein